MPSRARSPVGSPGGVASRDRDSSPSEQLGERAHAGAGDSDEMNWATVGGIEKVAGISDAEYRRANRLGAQE